MSITSANISATESTLIFEASWSGRSVKGIVSDIIIDHFVSKRFYSIFNENINDMEKKVLYTIRTYKKYFPEKFNDIFEWICRNKVMSSYSNLEFLERVFIGMSKRIKRGERLLSAVDEIKKNLRG